MLHKNSLSLAAIWVSAALLFSACSKQDSFVSADLPNENAFKAEKNLPEPKSTIFYALTNANELVKYSSGSPLFELSSVSIKGLVSSSEKLLAIDFRPATGQLYGVTNQSRLYVINQNTGTATAVSLTPFSPAINGTQVGFDFNPTVDRIRLVTNTD